MPVIQAWIGNNSIVRKFRTVETSDEMITEYAATKLP